jgi:ABC-2 type transport system permease protein
MKPLVGLYRLLLHQQLTRGRVVLALVLSGLAMLVTVLIARNADTGDQIEATVGFLSLFGLGLMVPILSLVLASSSLGQLVEDQILVYLWLRPNPRWMLATAAWLAAATVAVPVSVVPLTVAAAVGSGGDSSTMGAVAASMALGALAYTGLFTLLGLLVRRSLIWGLAYLFIWELFVARVGQGAARLSINTYPASVLAKMTDIELPQAERALGSGVVVPILAAGVAVALTAWRLNRANVA